MEKGVPVQAPSPKKKGEKGERLAPRAALPCELGLATGEAAEPPRTARAGRRPCRGGEAAQPAGGGRGGAAAVG